MAKDHARKIGRRRRAWLLAAAAIVVLGGSLALFLPRTTHIATAAVERGEFIIDVVSRGEIDALNSTNVSIPRGRRRMTLQIVRMAEEGSEVKAGDFLLQLDTSEAEQRVAEAENQLATARAELEGAQASIASTMAQLKSQLEREEYNYQQAELTQKMMQYEAEAKRREQELSMKKAEVDLNQAKQKITSQGIIDRATLMKAELKIQQAEADLQEARDALNSLTLNAPIDGLVVYKEIWSGSGMKKVQVGDTPWPGMPVIGIPDLSIMQANVTVNEVDISRVSKGQNVIITIDALGGATYYGSVTRVAPLARRESSTNIKVFDLEATIDSTDTRLRPGMTCECRIITGRVPETLSVPLQAVFEKDGQTVVYVMGGRAWKERTVEVGARTRDRVIITAGLEEGELVCLRDPTVPLEEIEEEDWGEEKTPDVARGGNGS